MSNIEIFERIAKQYDTDERIGIAKIIASTIRNYVIEGKEKNALDYGCGTGLVGLELTDSFKSIIFVDASLEMIKQIDNKINDYQINNATTLCADFTIETGFQISVDYIIMSQVLLHIKDVNLIISSLYKKLTQGGHLLIVDFNKEDSIITDKVHNGFNQNELIDICNEAGFSHVIAETFYYGKNIFINKDSSLFILDAKKYHV